MSDDFKNALIVQDLMGMYSARMATIEAMRKERHERAGCAQPSADDLEFLAEIDHKRAKKRLLRLFDKIKSDIEGCDE